MTVGGVCLDCLLFFVLLIFALTAASKVVFSLLALRGAYVRNEAQPILLIPVTHETTDVEIILRDALKLAKCSHSYCRMVICDMGASIESRKICELFSKEHGIELMDRDEAANLLGLT